MPQIVPPDWVLGPSQAELLVTLGRGAGPHSHKNSDISWEELQSDPPLVYARLGKLILSLFQNKFLKEKTLLVTESSPHSAGTFFQEAPCRERIVRLVITGDRV